VVRGVVPFRNQQVMASHFPPEAENAKLLEGISREKFSQENFEGRKGNLNPSRQKAINRKEHREHKEKMVVFLSPIFNHFLPKSLCSLRSLWLLLGR
jgi:hypothetical protein